MICCGSRTTKYKSAILAVTITLKVQYNHKEYSPDDRQRRRTSNGKYNAEKKQRWENHLI